MNETELERMEQIAHDTKKQFSYHKETGKWTWNNRGEEIIFATAEQFPTRLDALRDAVQPYIEEIA
jgi:hypothetical protein